MAQVITLLFTALLFQMSFAQREAPLCVQLKDAWERRFEREFQTSWNGKPFTCQGQQFIFALSLFDLNREYVSPNLDGKSAQLFAKVKAVTKSFLLADKDYDCKEVVATHRNGLTTICPLFFDEARERRSGIVVHEARHGFSDDPNHVKCVSGAYEKKEKPNCDQEFFAGSWQGSGYNAEVYFYNWNIKNRAKPNKLSDAVLRAYLRSMIPDRFVDITSEEVKEWRK